MSGLSTHGPTIKIKDKYPPPTMPLPARPSFFQMVQNQDPKNFTRPCRTNRRLAKNSPFNFHPPPSKTTTGPLSSCLLKRNQKNTIWRKGSSHYLTTCAMSPTFSTRPCRTNPRLAKDSPFNFHPPPPKQPRVLCHLVF